MEHLPENSVDQVLQNIYSHLAQNGLFVASVATFEIPHSNHHQCVHEQDWWNTKFKANGLDPIDHSKIFQLADFPRGASLHDWLPEDGKGFHIVCRKI